MESEYELISGWPDLASGAGTQLQILCYDVTSMMFHASLKLGRRENISYLMSLGCNTGKISSLYIAM